MTVRTVKTARIAGIVRTTRTVRKDRTIRTVRTIRRARTLLIYLSVSLGFSVHQNIEKSLKVKTNICCVDFE